MIKELLRTIGTVQTCYGVRTESDVDITYDKHGDVKPVFVLASFWFWPLPTFARSRNQSLPAAKGSRV